MLWSLGVELIGLVSACCIIWVADNFEGEGLGKDKGLGGLLADPTSGEIADFCGGSMTIAVCEINPAASLMLHLAHSLTLVSRYLELLGK